MQSSADRQTLSHVMQCIDVKKKIYKPLGSAQPYSIKVLLHLQHWNTAFYKKWDQDGDTLRNYWELR